MYTYHEAKTRLDRMKFEYSLRITNKYLTQIFLKWILNYKFLHMGTQDKIRITLLFKFSLHYKQPDDSTRFATTSLKADTRSYPAEYWQRYYYRCDRVYTPEEYEEIISSCRKNKPFASKQFRYSEVLVFKEWWPECYWK